MLRVTVLVNVKLLTPAAMVDNYCWQGQRMSAKSRQVGVA